MLVKIQEDHIEKYRKFGLDASTSYIVTAIRFSNRDGNTILNYLTNANVKKQGGLPFPIRDEDVVVVDGYLPPHWIAWKHVIEPADSYSVITFPEWAQDSSYDKKMADNETEEDHAATDKYGVELKGLCEHYLRLGIEGVYLEPFGDAN